MAQAAVLAVLSVTLATLRDLLLEEARFLSGIADQVKEIHGQLEMMKSFLKDADGIHHNEERVRTWIQQVRRLAYRIEDALETYAVEVVFKKERGIKNVLRRFACIFNKGKALHKVGKEIANINSEIAKLKSNRETFGIKDLNYGDSSKEANEKQWLLRQTYAHEVDEYFVGVKEESLVSLITGNGTNHPVISIWGMGGLGKTTLARKIFNHEDVQRSFEAFAWVCITQRCQIDKVLQDILNQILGKDIHGGLTTLVRELYKAMNEKKCLVVLDDIWKLDDWEILRPAFSIKDGSSKIIVTTREREVAKRGFLYELKLLAEQEGWDLLRRKAFSKPGEKDFSIEQSIERVGKETVRKCGYLPLAISVIGGILRGKSALREWKIVNEHIDLYLKRGEGHKEASQSVLNILALSYDELPYYLKPCFLYMGGFYEDELIEVEKLYQLWIAEGLVLLEHCGKEETMMDVADRYLYELASRCMVEVQMNHMSIVQRSGTCWLHDLMRDLCLAKGKEEDIFKFIDIHSRELPVMDLPDDGRRLCLYLDKDLDLNNSTPLDIQGRTYTELFGKVKGQHLRTLYVRRMNYSTNDFSLDISYLKKFKLLRVLVLENCQFEFPRDVEISQLMHLRYLSLRDSRVEELPPSICNLPYLQTLDLRTYSSTYVPNIFSKMKRLKHLYLPDEFDVSENLQFNNLSELETLHGFRTSGDESTNLTGLVNLRSFIGRVDSHDLSQIVDQIHSWRKVKRIELEIFGSDLMSEPGSSLVRKVLWFETLYVLEITSPIGKFPPYEPQCCLNLTWLTLKCTKIQEDPMQFLKKLPNLRELVLLWDAFVGEEMVCDSKAFPELRFLELTILQNLKKWRVDEGAMPNLSHLRINSCLKLETITNGLNFSALKRLDIWSMPIEFERKYRRLHSQKRTKVDKFQHQSN